MWNKTFCRLIVPAILILVALSTSVAPAFAAGPCWQDVVAMMKVVSAVPGAIVPVEGFPIEETFYLKITAENIDDVFHKLSSWRTIESMGYYSKLQAIRAHLERWFVSADLQRSGAGFHYDQQARQLTGWFHKDHFDDCPSTGGGGAAEIATQPIWRNAPDWLLKNNPLLISLAAVIFVLGLRGIHYVRQRRIA